MGRRTLWRWLLIAVAIVAAGHTVDAQRRLFKFRVRRGVTFTCTTTINPGANLATAISGAAAGSTLCLNSGSYPGPWDFGDITKASTVTIRSASGNGASVGDLRLFRTNRLTFSNITWASGVLIDDFGGTPHTANLAIKNSTFSTTQLVINSSGFSSSNVLVDGNTFTNYESTGIEGRLTVTRNPSTGTNAGITISNNAFSNGGCSDGIQITGSANGITIGPGNIFKDLLQGSCGPHVDALQNVDGDNVTITQNYFENDTIFLGFYDGGTQFTVTDNIFNTGQSAVQNFQIGGYANFTFSHNTVKSSTMAVGTKFANDPNNNWTVQNNVFQNSTVDLSAGDQPGCNTACTFSFNLFTSGGVGTNNVIGTPLYTGGPSPATWAGWLLTGLSPGKTAGSDGADMGSRFFGS